MRAAERLASAGGRAERRGDVRAATNLLARAVDLYPQDDPRKLKLLPALGRALTDAGEWGRADAVLSEAIEAGTASGDRWLVADATVAVAFVRIHREMDSTHQRIGAELAAAVKVFEEFGDEAGLARALGFAGNMRIWAGDTTGAIADLERAVEHARAAGDTVQEETSLSFIVLAVLRGPTPAAEGLLRCRELRDRPGLTPRLESAILRCESRLEAIQGNLDQARELNRAAAAIVERPGYGMTAAAITFESGEIELLAGNPERAEQIMRPAAEILLQTGDYGHYSSYAPWLAQALVLLDRDDEATEIIDLIAENTIDDDLDGQIAWRQYGQHFSHERSNTSPQRRSPAKRSAWPRKPTTPTSKRAPTTCWQTCSRSRVKHRRRSSNTTEPCSYTRRRATSSMRPTPALVGECCTQPQDVEVPRQRFNRDVVPGGSLNSSPASRRSTSEPWLEGATLGPGST